MKSVRIIFAEINLNSGEKLKQKISGLVRFQWLKNVLSKLRKLNNELTMETHKVCFGGVVCSNENQKHVKFVFNKFIVLIHVLLNDFNVKLSLAWIGWTYSLLLEQ